MSKPCKIPLRQCTGCRQMKEKRSLIRVVRLENGGFAPDETGKHPGRGAYICPEISCLAAAAKRKGLERSFGQPIPPETYESLKTIIEQMDKSLFDCCRL